MRIFACPDLGAKSAVSVGLLRRLRPLTIPVRRQLPASKPVSHPNSGRQGGHGDIGYSAISFTGVASAMGMEFASARTRSELTTRLQTSSDWPYLIEVCIDDSDYVAGMELARV